MRNWSKSKCGMIVIDPHGNLYDNLINWLAWTAWSGRSFRSMCVRMIGLFPTTSFDNASPLTGRPGPGQQFD
jgi:hypothetical protein